MAKTAPGGTGFGHERGSQGITNDWLTPKYITDALGVFQLDPCAAPRPRPWDIAKRHITLPDDGLRAPWEGRVWCNPPYGPDTGKWMRRMVEHNNGIALIFARPDTVAWQEWVFPFAEAILFLRGRIAFCRPDGTPGATSGAPSALIAFSVADAECLRRCSLPGTLVNIAERIWPDDEQELVDLDAVLNEEWETTFSNYVNDGYTDKEADAMTWHDMQNKFPRLCGYAGIKREVSA